MRPLPLLLAAALLGAAISAVLVYKIGQDKKRVEIQLSDTDARATRLAAELAAAKSQNGTLQADLALADAKAGKARDAQTAAEAHATGLAQALSKALSTVTVYEQTTRALTEELAALKADLADTRATFASPDAVSAYKNTIAELERQLASAHQGAVVPGAAGASTAAFASGQVGRATVLSVGPSNAFVVLNFGTARGAQLGQRLTVNRGTDAIATVLISDVRPNFAIAQVQPDTLHGVLQKGDLAVLIRTP